MLAFATEQVLGGQSKIPELRIIVIEPCHDRDLMKTHFSGIRGPLPWEDIAVVESMGPIVDRTLEILGSTDVIIIQNRRLVLGMLKSIEKGQPPEIDGSLIDNLSDLRGVAFRASTDVNWREVDGKSPPEYN